MITIFNKIDRLAQKLQAAINSKTILDYRIALRMNDDVVAIVKIINFPLESKLIGDLSSIFMENPELLTIETFTAANWTDNDFQELFESKPKSYADRIHLETSRRRFTHLLGDGEKFENKPCPVVTFYSYKGGVGRSTSLAAFAMYMATQQAKKVVIIDCDLEAPGFNNFFLQEPSTPTYQNGFVEYMLDSEAFEEITYVENYVYGVDQKFRGDGQIYVMPAGNLGFDEQMSSNANTKDWLVHNVEHYLEGMARLDFTSPRFFFEKFKTLIANLHKAYTPDVILIDSRTGFNDMFGITAFGISDTVVGFFGGSAQSMPGLYEFLKRLGNKAIIANSILPERYDDLYNRFNEQVQQYGISLTDDKDIEANGQPVIKTFPIPRSATLEYIGTSGEKVDDFVKWLKKDSSELHRELFDEIIKTIESNDNNLALIDDSVKAEKDKALIGNSVKTEKEIIIDKLKQDWPKLYATSVANFSVELKEGRYFFRSFMKNLFGKDIFLFIGSKGTGKTYIYESLKNKDVVDTLKQWSNNKANDYHFIHAIEPETDNRFFNISTNLPNPINLMSSETYYERFWKIYIWKVLIDYSTGKSIGFNSVLTDAVYKIKISKATPTDTARQFNVIITSDEYFSNIEKELVQLDEFLYRKPTKTFLAIIFDRFDEMVLPVESADKIAPLIRFWRYNPYKCIMPKIFYRRDLFEKLSNLTNINELKNSSSSIEWSQEELFSYFFKIVSATSEKKIETYMNTYQNQIKGFIEKVHSKKTNGQLREDRDYLKYYVIAFFGESADSTTRNRWESYDWFYNNLQNANQTISLRTFLDLLQGALDKATNDSTDFPILPNKYYAHRDVRSNAVENHFNDIANEKGNEAIRNLKQFIQSHRRFQFRTLSKNQFEEMLIDILKEESRYDENNKKNQIKDMKDLLILNGIVEEKSLGRGNVNYEFAYLYKYYFGLQGK